MADRMTPDDVRDQTFKSRGVPVWLGGRPGYDEDEVDEFLDAVEEQIEMDMREIDALRTRVAAVDDVIDLCLAAASSDALAREVLRLLGVREYASARS